MRDSLIDKAKKSPAENLLYNRDPRLGMDGEMSWNCLKSIMSMYEIKKSDLYRYDVRDIEDEKEGGEA